MWRTVVIQKQSKLELKLSNLIVRDESGFKSININEINTLIIENTAVAVTCSLLEELVKNKVNIIICDEKHNPSSQLLSIYGGFDTSRKIHNQINFNDHVKEKLWQHIVEHKIQKQSEVLKILKKENSDLLDQYAKNVEPGDISNREGHAAKVYFNSLFGKDFIRGDDDPINQALNYGYSVLLSYFNREIVSEGYITQLGIHHKNVFNDFNLSCDLMEPFRPLIDYKVYSLDNSYDLDKEKKSTLVNIFNDQIINKNQRVYLSNFIKQYCISAFEYLSNDGGELAKYNINNEKN